MNNDKQINSLKITNHFNKRKIKVRNSLGKEVNGYKMQKIDNYFNRIGNVKQRWVYLVLLLVTMMQNKEMIRIIIKIIDSLSGKCLTISYQIIQAFKKECST